MEISVWYFTWILGLGLAVFFGVLNAMWLELEYDRAKASGRD
jgi:cytochrome bd-I ubiquinol oxidase subunit X